MLVSFGGARFFIFLIHLCWSLLGVDDCRYNMWRFFCFSCACVRFVSLDSPCLLCGFTSFWPFLRVAMCCWVNWIYATWEKMILRIFPSPTRECWTRYCCLWRLVGPPERSFCGYFIILETCYLIWLDMRLAQLELFFASPLCVIFPDVRGMLPLGLYYRVVQFCIYFALLVC